MNNEIPTILSTDIGSTKYEIRFVTESKHPNRGPSKIWRFTLPSTNESVCMDGDHKDIVVGPTNEFIAWIFAKTGIVVKKENVTSVSRNKNIIEIDIGEDEDLLEVYIIRGTAFIYKFFATSKNTGIDLLNNQIYNNFVEDNGCLINHAWIRAPNSNIWESIF